MVVCPGFGFASNTLLIFINYLSVTQSQIRLFATDSSLSHAGPYAALETHKHSNNIRRTKSIALVSNVKMSHRVKLQTRSLQSYPLSKSILRPLLEVERLVE